MHRPTTFKTFGPIKGSFWTPKLQKIKWGEYCGTPCKMNCEKNFALKKFEVTPKAFIVVGTFII